MGRRGRLEASSSTSSSARENRLRNRPREKQKERQNSSERTSERGRTFVRPAYIWTPGNVPSLGYVDRVSPLVYIRRHIICFASLIPPSLFPSWAHALSSLLFSSSLSLSLCTFSPSLSPFPPRSFLRIATLNRQ